jgi:hypothetical protein
VISILLQQDNQDMKMTCISAISLNLFQQMGCTPIFSQLSRDKSSIVVTGLKLTMSPSFICYKNEQALNLEIGNFVNWNFGNVVKLYSKQHASACGGLHSRF